jgi:large subunit ribosomal protein L25
MSKETTVDLVLDVQPREFGKASARKARSLNMVPAVVYGPKVKNMVLQTPEKAIRKFISHQYDNSIFTFKSTDSKLNDVAVLMKHKEIHPLTRRLTHVDFYALDLTKTIRVSIELRFNGKPRGIADGGFFQPIERNIEVECLPNKIPSHFDLDVSDLGVHESLHASNVALPEGVKLITEGEVTLCTVTIIKEEEVVVAPVAAAEPEVIGKGKKEEGEGAAAAAPGAAAPAAPAKDAKKT